MNSLTIDELKQQVGQELGTSEPFEVTQDRVNLFADATEDPPVDSCRSRAGAQRPVRRPIAHGYPTLSLLPHLLGRTFQVSGIKMGVNYGLNRLRFPAPVPVGSSVRATFTLNDLKEIEGGAQVLVGFELRVDGAGKPAAVGEAVTTTTSEQFGIGDVDLPGSTLILVRACDVNPAASARFGPTARQGHRRASLYHAAPNGIGQISQVLVVSRSTSDLASPVPRRNVWPRPESACRPPRSWPWEGSAGLSASW